MTDFRKVAWLGWALMLFLFFSLYASHLTAAILTVTMFVVYFAVAWVIRRLSLMLDKEQYQMYFFLTLPLVSVLVMVSSPPEAISGSEPLCILELPRQMVFNCTVGDRSRLIYSQDPDFSIINYESYGCAVHEVNNTFLNYKVMSCNETQPFPNFTRRFTMQVEK